MVLQRIRAAHKKLNMGMAMIMIEELIQIICSRKNGATKKEIFETAKVFNINIEYLFYTRCYLLVRLINKKLKLKY